MSSVIETPFVLVTGGKGGVGKTTVAANLGVEMSGAGKRVLIVDLDLGLANLNVLLGLDAPLTIEDALTGAAEPADCVIPGPGGVHVLPAGSGTERMGRLTEDHRERLVELIAEVASDYDVVIGDSSAGIGPDVMAFASIADRGILKAE